MDGADTARLRCSVQADGGKIQHPDTLQLFQTGLCIHKPTSFYDQAAAGPSGLALRISSRMVPQKHEAACNISVRDPPFLQKRGPRFVVEGFFAACDQTGGKPQFRGGQSHVFGTAEGVRNAVQKILRPENRADRGGAVKSASDRGVVDDAGLF